MSSRDLYASLWTRLLAHNIDLVILLIPVLLTSGFIEQDRLLYTASSVWYLAYHVLFELSPWHGSPGKRIMRVEVQSSSSKNFPVLRLLLRNLLKVVSVAPILAGFFMILFSRRRQALHDRIAGCVHLHLESGRES